MDIIQAASPDVNAVVSASAGTGKTWLLIARLLRLLLAGVPPGSILAITFTEKAVAEIMERLRKRLQYWTQIDQDLLIADLTNIGIKQTASVTHQARLLYEQLLSAKEPIQVVTFHTFCAELLRRFPFESKAPFGFDILSETWELRQAAFKKLFTEAVKPKNKALFNALQTLNKNCQGLNNTSKTLESFLNYYNDWRSFVGAEKEPAAAAAEYLRTAMRIDPQETITIPEQLRVLLTRHAGLLELHTSKDFQKRLAHIRATEQSDAIVNEQTLADLKAPFFTQKNECRKNRLSKIFTEKLLKNGHSCEEFETQFAEAAAQIMDIEKKFLAKCTWQNNAAWYIAGNRFLEIYETLKKNRHVLDFSDLEWMASCLIHDQGATTVHYYLNQRVKHILIDEFQDTSTSQWNLILPLLKEMAAQPNTGSIFIVGDIKQSIYGFRRANPQLQIEAGNWLTAHMNGEKYEMDISRRSSNQIIQLINDVFTRSRYQNKLQEFRPHTTVINMEGAAEILPFCAAPDTDNNKPWRSVLRDPPAMQTDNPHQQEAKIVADKIIELMNKNILVHTTDAENRTLRYGDIMILLRTRKNMIYFEEALTKNGISFISSNADKSLESIEITDILALLRFLLEPDDNFSLAQVLRSPLFSASDEHLIQLAEHDQKVWFETVQELAHTDPLWKRAEDLLNQWLPLRDTIPIHDLLDKIYAEGAVIQRYRMSVPAEEADLVENKLSQLLNYALDFESGRYPNIRSFLQYIDDRDTYYRSYSSQETAAVKSLPLGPDQVSILTIHQAKGLEAPAVFLADCGKQGYPHSTYNTLVSWESTESKPTDFLLVPVQKNLDDYTNKALQKSRDREAREEMNLLYVAITRARQLLFISGSGKKESQNEDDQDDWYHTLKPYMTESKIKPVSKTSKKIQVSPPSSTISATPIPIPSLLNELHPSKLIKFQPQRGNKKSQTRGVVIHRALDLLTRGISVDRLRQQLTEEFSQLAPKNITDWSEFAAKLIAHNDLKELFDNSVYQHVFNELPISFTHQNQQFYGIIDRLCITEQSAWLIDYKTHSRATERISDLQESYREQMRAYFIGVSLLYPQHEIRTSLLLTDNANLIDYGFNQNDLVKSISLP